MQYSAVKLTTEAQREARYARLTSERTCHTTPAIRAFLQRPDVRELRFPSGSVHIYGGNTSYVGDTLLQAVESAMRGLNDAVPPTAQDRH